MEPQATLAMTACLGPLSEAELKHAPSCLHLVGDRALLSAGTRIALVGSRRASREGLQRARALSKALVERGITVVSGLAEGIDTAAHRAAIEFGGRTVAVIGTSIDEAYPRSNRELQAQIAAEHLLVSQFEPGSLVQKKNFPLRNRTMALLSDATVIVEAGVRSGTEHQAWEALRIGRPLYLMESVTKNRFEWTEKLLGYGAQVLTRENLESVLEDIPGRVGEQPVSF